MANIDRTLTQRLLAGECDAVLGAYPCARLEVCEEVRVGVVTHRGRVAELGGDLDGVAALGDQQAAQVCLSS